VVEGVLAIREPASSDSRPGRLPGLPPIYGTGDSTDNRGAGKGAAPSCRTRKLGDAQSAAGAKLFEKVRDAVGWDVTCCTTCTTGYPDRSRRLGKDLDLPVFWLEDAIPGRVQEGFRIIRQHTTQRCGGEGSIDLRPIC